MNWEQLKNTVKNHYPHFENIIDELEKTLKIKPDKCYLNYNATELILILDKSIITVIPIKEQKNAA